MTLQQTSPRTPLLRDRLDPQRWADVVRVPTSSPPRTAVARAVITRALSRLPLRVLLGDRVLGRGGPLLEVHDPEAFTARLARDGLIGFGESYQAGEWDAPDLAGTLTVMAEQLTTLVPPALQRLRRLWEARQPAGAGSEAAARSNIRAHYDLSNELFGLFLDDSLTYSSAVFEQMPARWEQLERAQHAKIDRLLDLACVGPGSRVLEIGTGWGELCVRAARRGATVVSLTLSQEQHDLGRDRVRAAGCADAVEIRLQDYRRLDPERDGRFDAVVSVEMIEAVGVDHWPTYFRTLDTMLAPGGRVALQAITMPHDRLLATRRTYTWIHKYIFPGGMLPSNEAIDEATRAHSALRVTESEGFGTHYAETLRLWRERFTAHAAEVAELGFDEAFRRMWTLYLAYSEAGFRSGYLDVRQILLTREDEA
ncbi:SAM-dependent methyltransferase [Streptacidiphilus jiangxiensis]|uniref:Cyclopropane-fatty-acyl-phospholipid synthase n=1 Tax=Streptacidiphilus jiangxiensis TaxID=235985 RepID=A0A1H7N3K9_STRJI|nr:cyclopropane-fatty-acyl-phospholipid synthase family protein [Streptacidiphilus jiangxiensis]SEL17911.1 cyclopropane-fatty-acyl-phospholipid synthase [Streptacidiphilus jiangxiensis]